MRKRPWQYPLGLGDRVYDIADPRHVGHLRWIGGGRARVEWEETGWLSHVNYDDLRKAEPEPSTDQAAALNALTIFAAHMNMTPEAILADLTLARQLRQTQRAIVNARRVA